MSETQNISTGLKNTLKALVSKTNEKSFIIMARKSFNALASLFTVVLAVQWYEAHGHPSLAIVATMAVTGTMYALANKCQTYLLKLRIEELVNGGTIPVFGSDEPKMEV